jgi:hypothetical protein
MLVILVHEAAITIALVKVTRTEHLKKKHSSLALTPSWIRTSGALV